jgi:hypothetical protein
VLIGIEVDSLPKGAKHLRKHAREVTVEEGAAQANPSEFVLTQYKDKGVVNYGSKNFRVFELSYVEPGTIYIALVVKSIGKNRFVLASRIPDLKPIGSELPSGTVIAHIRRLAYIEGISYFVDLYFWKMSD